MLQISSAAWYLVRSFFASVIQHWSLALISVALAASLWLFVTDRENPTEAQTFNGSIAIKFVNVPNNLAVSNVSETSVGLRIEAPKNELSGLRADDFNATVDLGGVTPGTSNQLVTVTSSNSRINIVSVTPPRVDVTVENQRSKEVPVRVALTGSPQQGFAAGSQDVSPGTVTVTGAESLVTLVDHVSAEVNLTGLRVDFTDDRVDLKPRDVREGEISRVQVNPTKARVSVQIEQREFSLEFAITPTITGAPAAGYDVGQISVEPHIVTVTGALEALQSIDAVKGLATEEISIADARADVVRQVQPVLPADVRLQGSPTVRVTIAIRPARGEATFQVVPQIRNIRGGLTLASQPATVSVTLAGDVPALQAITPESITVVADAQGLGRPPRHPLADHPTERRDGRPQRPRRARRRAGAAMTEATQPTAPRPIVAIVGRPNVGKSALFNRMIGGRPALVEDLPGTTRDRIYGDVEWRARTFKLVDTGGLEPDVPGTYTPLVRAQVEYALSEAAIVLFVIDTITGVTAADEEVADLLRRTAKPVLLLANKSDNRERRDAAVAFYELGLGDPIPISAHHGEGVAEVLDMIVDTLPPDEAEAAEDESLRLAIVGRPNVGKSSLLNAILGEERVIVSDVPGTTRDAIDTPFTFEEHPLVLVDTAGLRRRGAIEAGVEKHSTLRARRALERAQVALCVFDMSEGFTAQDSHVVGYALDALRGVIVVANKWDLVRGGEWDQEDYESRLRWQLKFASWISIRFVSAKEGIGVSDVLAEAVRIGAERKRHVETGPLNQAVRKAVAQKPPPTPSKGARIKLLYVTQAEVDPPTFVFFLNDASAVHFSYRRYMENVIRRNFGFNGTAIKLVFRGRADKDDPQSTEDRR